MMAGLLDLLATALLPIGSIFLIIGGVGLMRFPDFLTRIHA
ncbi:MAG TPA: hypothetical protein DDW89_02760, partial [Gammaproteobacteria bacterium]|nr:hypothetical protein [Gammaproteobacteria bacterium]